MYSDDKQCVQGSRSIAKKWQPLLVHVCLFITTPCVREYPQPMEIMFLDLETTGVFVVEDPNVFVETQFQGTRDQEAVLVHCISHGAITVSL